MCRHHCILSALVYCNLSLSFLNSCALSCVHSSGSLWLENSLPIVERIDEDQKNWRSCSSSRITAWSYFEARKETDSFSDYCWGWLKTFASTVTRSCTDIKSAKNIEGVVRKVVDKDDRSKSVIINGVKDSENEKLQEKVEEVLTKIEENLPLFRDCELEL